MNVIKLCKALSKLELPTRRKGSREERTHRNKLIIRHSLGFEPRSTACRADALPTELGCQPAEHEYLFLIGFQIHNFFRRFLFFTWTLFDML